jgi:hypothetical protein
MKTVKDQTASGLEADMDDAPRDHEGTGHDASTTVTTPTVTTPEAAMSGNIATLERAPDKTPASEASASEAPSRSLRTLWYGRRARLLRTAVIAVTLALFALLLPGLIVSNARRPAAQVRPTATLQPTATASPTPTPMRGFQYVADTEDGFTLQAPEKWTCAQTNPGIECRDDANAPNYKAQVQLPGDWTVPGTQPNAEDASPWVNYALNAFSETPGQAFERVPGPTATVAINGVRWQTSGGLISVDPGAGGNTGATQGGTPTATPTIHIRVQVYATIHNGKPYLIALYATEEQFVAATNNYYLPMLRSFQFTPIKV